MVDWGRGCRNPTDCVVFDNPSLPFAFAKAGLIGGVILQLCSAAAAWFSLFMLVAAARRTGARTYGEVAGRVFGPGLEMTVTLLTLMLTFMTVIAYEILLRDIVTSATTSFRISLSPGEVLLLLISTVIFPVALNRNLSSLSFVTPLSLGSMVVLTVTVGGKGVIHALENLEGMAYNLWPSSPLDIFRALPIITLSYVCHFNTLGIHAELFEPTRPRLQLVIGGSVIVSSIIYLVFGVTGYLYGGDATQGDVLNNFSDDPGIMIGRAGLAVALLCNIPLMVLPARNIILELTAVVRNKLLTAEQASLITINREGDTHALTTPSSSSTHVLVTAAILLGCHLCATYCPSVEVVWGICGSSVGVLLALTFPSAIYLRLRAHKPLGFRMRSTWLLFGVSAVLLIICNMSLFSLGQRR